MLSWEISCGRKEKGLVGSSPRLSTENACPETFAFLALELFHWLVRVQVSRYRGRSLPVKSIVVVGPLLVFFFSNLNVFHAQLFIFQRVARLWL